MPSPKLVLGGAGAAALGVRLARTLHGRWRSLPSAERERIAPLAERAKASALDLRGSDAAGRADAERDLQTANEHLAAALMESAEGDPELGEVEVRELREDLRRELARLAGADIKASRGTTRANEPGG